MTIDSMPGAREPPRGGDSALAVIETLESLPRMFASKKEFVAAIRAAGYSRALAEWLALNVEPTDGGVQFALNLHELRVLVLDYFRRDLWPVVEHPPFGVHLHLVIADRSTSYAPTDRVRACALVSDQVTVDVLPAGHWVHVDDSDGLLRVMLNRIPEF